MGEPKTRQGQAAFRYLREHAGAGPSEVAKAVGCKRETARGHIRAFMAETTTEGVRPDLSKPPAESATPPPVATGRIGHRFEEDFPMKPKEPKKPAPKPDPDEPDDEGEDDDFELEW